MIELLLAAALLPQKQQNPPDVKKTGADLAKVFSEAVKPKPGDNLWRPTKLSVAQLAAKVEASVRNIKNTEVAIKMLAQTSEGRGQFDGIMRIRDNRNYRMDTFVVKPQPVTAIYTSNGKSRFVLYDGQFKPKSGFPAGTRLASATSDPKKLVQLFPIEFGRLMFQGLTDGLDSWGPVLNAWNAGATGYKVKIEERVMTYAGKKILTYRVLADRTPAAAKTQGSSKIELRVDGTNFLPVTVRETRVDLKKKTWIIQWSSIYSFGKKFNADDFRITS